MRFLSSNRSWFAWLSAVVSAILLTVGAHWPGHVDSDPGDGSTDLYVSPTGSDTNPGTLAEPFKTLGQAQIAVRGLNADMAGDIRVNLAGGTYRLTAPLTLDSSDSGSNGHQVVWQARPGQTPVISGGTQIADWQEIDSTKHIWSADVPAGLDTRQLFVDGTRADRAKSSSALPTGSVVTSTGFTVPGTDLQSIANPSDLEFIFQPVNWAQQRCDVDSITGTATQTSVVMKQPCWDTVHVNTSFVAGLPTSIENSYSYLDQPGEWYLDRNADKIFYIPRAGQNMNCADAEVPVQQTLLVGAGTTAAPVHDLTFSGITFAHTTWLQPSQGVGFPEVQANLTFPAPGTGGPGAGTGSTEIMMPNAVEFHTARNVTFSRNTFAHLGTSGLGLNQGSKNNTVIGNVFSDISGNGLQVGSVAQPNQSNADLIDESNSITNNYVHDVAAEYQGGVGMYFGYVRHTVIAHNEIADLPYTGISLGWGWGNPTTLPTISTDNHVTANYIHDVMQVLGDGGPIYNLGPQPAGTISGNHLENVVNGKGAMIYLDQGSSGWGVSDNVVQGGLFWFRNNANTYDPSTISVSHNYIDAEDQFVGHATITHTSQLALTAFPASIVDAAGLEDAYADLNPVTPPSDTTPPSAPAAPTETAPSRPTEVDLSWTSPTDNVGVTGFEIYANGTLVGATAQTTFTADELVSGDTYTFTIKARDAAGNLSAASAGLSETLPVDTQAPATPQAPTAMSPYPTAVDLTWPATTDDWGVANYLVYRDGALVGTTAGTSLRVEGEVGSHSYSFTIAAKDAAGNISPQSPATAVTTSGQSNLSIGGTASAYYINGTVATLQPNQTPANAIDGNLTTKVQASGQWAWQLQVDLGAAHDISAVVIRTPANTYPTEYDIKVSSDGTNWTTARSVTGFGGGTSGQYFATSINARYVRIVAIKPDAAGQPGIQMAINELEVYGV